MSNNSRSKFEVRDIDVFYVAGLASTIEFVANYINIYIGKVRRNHERGAMMAVVRVYYRRYVWCICP